jgi:ComF family protein
MMSGKVYNTLQRWLPAQPCALCRAPLHQQIPLCDACRTKLPALPHPPLELLNSGDWNQIIIPFFYREPLAPLLQQLKFDHKLHHARLFGLLFEQHLQQQPLARPERIIPVPLHPQRLRERGFNQAVEIIKGPARSLRIPLDRTHCQRIRNTPAQMGLGAKARRENLRQAFRYDRSLQGCHVALFDDVVTTGSTLQAVAAALRHAGAKKIDLWALAYTPPHQ